MINRNHKSFLMGFAIICLAHWAEHLVMAWQAWVEHLPMDKALGLVGYFYPWLIKSELLHYGFAVVMLAGLWLLRQGFSGTAHTWWMAAFGIQFWHHFEHLLLVVQALTHTYWFGMNMPMSIGQLWIPRMTLHLVYNTAVTIPMVVAMVLYYRRPTASNRHQITGFVRHDGSVMILTDPN